MRKKRGILTKWFDACLAIFNMVQLELLEDGKSVLRTIGLAGDLAAMHLWLLREQDEILVIRPYFDDFRRRVIIFRR
jgi:aspartate/methionine/tyrosine aminotransferase